MGFCCVLQTRVRLGFGREKAFVPTANVRNPHMLEEAEAFSLQLKDFQRAVADYHRNVQGKEGGLTTLQSLLLLGLLLAGCLSVLLCIHNQARLQWKALIDLWQVPKKLTGQTVASERRRSSCLVVIKF